MNVLTALVFAALGLYAILVGIVFIAQDKMIFPAPPGPDPETGASAALAHVEVPLEDGAAIAALWHPPEDGEATVLFLHGNGTAVADLAPLFEALATEGFGVLAPAYRGYPGSMGHPSEANVLADALAAYDWAAERGGEPVALLGQSLGAAAAIHVAVEREPLGAVLVSPFDSMRAMAAARMRVLPVDLLLRHPFRSDMRIGAVKAPILIVHGDDDALIPPVVGRRLHALAPKGTLFEFVPGAGHNDMWAHGVLGRTVAFFRDVRAGGGSDASNRSDVPNRAVPR